MWVLGFYNTAVLVLLPMTRDDDEDDGEELTAQGPVISGGRKKHVV